MIKNKKRTDPLAERCLQIVGPELKDAEGDAINEAMAALASNEGLSADKAIQLWQRVAVARDLYERMEKQVKRGIRIDAIKAKSTKAD